MEKLTRISFNSSGWLRPTGDARKYEAPGTYNHEQGFGHEDWLFRIEWQIDGWRYAFIEGVNRSHRRLVKEHKPFDLTLFTIQPDKRRRYVAAIRAAECLDTQQAKDALKAFKTRGWLRTMLREMKKVAGNAASLGDAKWAKHILNIRFRLENLSHFGPARFAHPDDPVILMPFHARNLCWSFHPRQSTSEARVGLRPSISRFTKEFADSKIGMSDG